MYKNLLKKKFFCRMLKLEKYNILFKTIKLFFCAKESNEK